MKHELKVVEKGSLYTPEVFGVSKEDAKDIEYAILRHMVVGGFNEAGISTEDAVFAALKELDLGWDAKSAAQHFILGYCAAYAHQKSKKVSDELNGSRTRSPLADLFGM